MTDTSQYGEASAIVQHFAGRVGRFLDIGAYDGKALSNTWPLAELGWSGVCVEPSPVPFCGLMQNHAGNPRVKLVNAALDTQPWTGLQEFHATADALSTFNELHFDSFAKAGYPFQTILIPVGITWPMLLGAVGSSFDYVNVDVEGLNVDVLDAMPIRPELLCVEIDPADGSRVVETMTAWDYKVRIIGGNALGARG